MTNDDIMARAEAYIGFEEHREFRGEVQELIDKRERDEITERFWRELDFGTGGLRGVIGGGDNRINPYVIRKATQGLANYIAGHVAESERGVVVAYDSRRCSELFAREAARVLAANGIRTWLFSSLRPTPVLSFAVRRLGACTGIMITASHNPAKYNGYKVFWSDGAQVVPPHDQGIIAEVRRITGPVPAMDPDEAERKGLIIPVDKDIDDSYRAMVVSQSLNPDLMKSRGGSFKIVYSPLHGAGTLPVETVLNELGISVITVPEQREADGDFPTVEFPNPETAPALKMALDLASRENADLVMATDPDADRLGIAVNSSGKWTRITGNQLGALLADYIFRIRKEQGSLPANPAFINTIVTSEFQNRIAESYGAVSFRVLTGFKYIGEKIRQFEAERTYDYVFGGEESYGYLVGSGVRDKDAVSAAALTAEAALWNRERGMTLLGHLEELWARFGYYEEVLIGRDFEGQQGQKIMSALMETLRNRPPKDIAGTAVDSVRDFLSGTTRSPSGGEAEKNLMLPSSNVLQFVLADGALVTARPSGTEPKVKFYASCRSERGDDPARARDEIQSRIAGIEDWVNAAIASAGG